MIFDDTKELLQATERTVLDLNSSKHKRLDRFGNIFFYNIIGFIYLEGNSDIIKRTSIVAIIVWLLYSLWSGFTTSAMIINGVFAFVIAIILGSLIMPSKITSSEVKSSDVEFIHDSIKKKKLSYEQLQAIKDNLSILETAFDIKTKTSKWLIAALWAIFLYLFTQYYLPDAIAGKSVTIKASLLSLFSMIFIAMFYLFTVSFCRTGKKVFMTLSFALNEESGSELVRRKTARKNTGQYHRRLSY